MRVLLLAVAATLLLASPAAAAPAWLAPQLRPRRADAGPAVDGPRRTGGDGTAVAAWAQSVPSGADRVHRSPACGSPVEGFRPRRPHACRARPGAVGRPRRRRRRRERDDPRTSSSGSLVVVPVVRAAAAGSWRRAPDRSGPGDASGRASAVGRGGTAVASRIDAANVNAPQVRAAVPHPGRAATSARRRRVSSIRQRHTARSPAFTLPWATAARHRRLGAHQSGPRCRRHRGERARARRRLRTSHRASRSRITTRAADAARPWPSTPPVAPRSLWTNSRTRSTYAERAPARPVLWSTKQRVDRRRQHGAPAGGRLDGAERRGRRGVAVERGDRDRRPTGRRRRVRRPPDLSRPGMNASLRPVAVGGNGDALITWSLGDAKAISTVQRKASGRSGRSSAAVDCRRTRRRGENRTPSSRRSESTTRATASRPGPATS